MTPPVSFISKRLSSKVARKCDELCVPRFVNLYTSSRWVLPDAILCTILVGLCIVFDLTNSTTLQGHVISFNR